MHKKILIITVFLIIISSFSFSEVISIKAAKEMEDYNYATVKGTVTVTDGPFEGNIFFIQDETAGINVYGRSVDFSKLGLKLNDTVQVYGMMYTHKQNREIVVESIDTIRVLGTSTAPYPVEMKTKDINLDINQGFFVKTSGKILEIDFPKVYIDDGSGKTMVYIRENTQIKNIFTEDVNATFCGVIGKYNNDVELWPRSIDDIEIVDLVPPEIVFIKVIDKNTLNVYFNEELGIFTPVLNKTVKIKNTNIIDFIVSEKNTVTITTSDELPEDGFLYIKNVKDKYGNNSLLRKHAFSYKDKFVLFDEAHGQGAGNADWTIKGGFSDFADDIIELGYKVYSATEKISSEYLDNFDVLILPEPNKPYDKAEIEAFEDFVNNGGGIFLISDHGGADRNGNGWDAVRVFNVFSPDFFGIKFNSDDLERFEINGILKSPFTENVNSIAVWNGCSIEVMDENAEIAAELDGNAFVVYGTAGNGKFVAIGDSSPFDDGVGATGKMLYNGYFMHDIQIFSMNVVNWLAN